MYIRRLRLQYRLPFLFLPKSDKATDKFRAQIVRAKAAFDAPSSGSSVFRGMPPATIVRGRHLSETNLCLMIERNLITRPPTFYLRQRLRNLFRPYQLTSAYVNFSVVRQSLRSVRSPRSVGHGLSLVDSPHSAKSSERMSLVTPSDGQAYG